jgi:hypothetical protein
MVEKSLRPFFPLSLATVIARNDGLIGAEIDNEVVAPNIESGGCYALNRVGSRSRRLLGVAIRVSALYATLLAEYKVEPTVCERQVLDLLEDLRAEGLIATLEEK